MQRFLLAAAMAGLALTGCIAPAVPQPPSATATASESDHDSLVSDGRDIAEGQCARCHAVGRIGESPNPAAPTFRTVLSRYRADVLEEELTAGIRVSHPMPEFQFNPQGVHALVAYLRSIQEPQPAAR